VGDFNKLCRVVVELQNAKRNLFVSSFDRKRESTKRTLKQNTYLSLEIRTFFSGNHAMGYKTQNCRSAEKRQDYNDLRPNDGTMLVLGQPNLLYVSGCWANFTTQRAALVIC
jgi:hypothetical protein